MKPNEIKEILDLAQKIRKMGGIFNPLFAGDAGIGKSEICQAWAKDQQKTNPKFGFLDLRLAFLEPPDVIGTPRVIEGKTVFALPDFWPTEGEGLLLLEEPNRAPTSVTNTVMQLLTDRKVHGYSLPEGWIIAGAINPETTAYDVNSMDAALKNRFQIYEVNYDRQSFVDFMKSNSWHQNVVNFVESGAWIFKATDEIGDEGTYISPRSLKALQNAEKADIGSNPTLHMATSISILGKHVGLDYHKFVFEQSPVTLEDLLNDNKRAVKRLKDYSNPTSYRGDMVDITIRSLVDGYPDKTSNEVLKQVAGIIPKDQSVNLLVDCYKKAKANNIDLNFNSFVSSIDESLVKLLKERLGAKKEHK